MMSALQLAVFGHFWYYEEARTPDGSFHESSRCVDLVDLLVSSGSNLDVWVSDLLVRARQCSHSVAYALR